MSTFPAHFRECLVPQLQSLCIAEGACVTAGVESFEGAYQAVMRYAIERGALHLPGDILERLEDWICTTLAKSCG